MDDLISRRAAIDRINGTAYAEQIKENMIFILRMLPSALGTNLAEVGTDAISRDAVKELLNNNGLPHHINPVLWEELNDLPSAQPKRGRWIKLDMHRGMADYKCTACKQECYVPTCMGEPMYAFCPNCGAKMEVTNE